ncbi:MAG: glycosyltransferase family 4 protein [Planctomycetes bacterium]|nr:glycosyltransferase family 4 protein [Planctomycetota bacterium]
MSMTVYYINHYASPPSVGRGERPLHIAKAFARHGHRCIILGASRHHLQFPEATPQEETIIREADREFFLLPTAAYSGNSIGRLWNMVSFGRQIRGLKRLIDGGKLSRPDLLIASSPHPFAYDGAAGLAKTLGCPVIFEERDLWPLSLIEIAGVHPWHPVVWWMRRIVRHACKHAAGVVSLLPNAHEALMELGLPRERFHWIPNGIDVEAWDGDDLPLPEEHRSALDEARRENKLVAVYAGAHGPANELNTLVDIPAADSDSAPYRIMLIGDGPSKPALIERVKAMKCTHLRFLSPLPKAALRGLLRQSDVGYIGLKDCPLFRFGVSPNKVFDYMIAGLPVVWAIRAGNSPIDEAQAGIAVPPGDPVSVDKALRELSRMTPSEREAMGAHACEYVKQHHAWSVLGDRYVALCEKLV